MSSSEENPYKQLNMGPKSRALGCSLVEPRDEAMNQLLGYYTHGGIAISQDQLTKFARWLKMDPKDVHARKKDHDIEAFVKTGNRRNVFRTAEHHGMRLIAFLAGRGLLEEGKDPVESLAEMLYEYLEQPFHLEEQED